MNQKKTSAFIRLFEKIHKFELEIVRVKHETRMVKLEQQIEAKQPITDYKVAHLDLDEEEKQVFIDNFTKPKLIYEYIPYWNVTLLDSDTKYSESATKMMLSSMHENTGKYQITEDQLELILDHLECDTIGDLTVHLRENRQTKEYGIFDKANMYYLNRDEKLDIDILKNFANKVLILTKER
jgi:hypothetical protein